MERIGGEGMPHAYSDSSDGSHKLHRYHDLAVRPLHLWAAAALVFPALLFPQFSPLAGTLASFATFAVGFLARVIEASDVWCSRFERGSQLGIQRESIRASGRSNFGHRAIYCG